MNKRQKEVLEYLYKNEKAAIKELEKQYKRTIADIEERIKVLQADELTQSKMYQLEYQRNLKKQVDAILEKLHADEYTTIQQYLNDSYTNAFVGTMYDLHGQGVPLLLPIDQEAAVNAILTDSKLSNNLYDSLGVDVNNMKKSIRQEITRGIAGGMSYIDIARNIQSQTKAPFSRVKTIVRTESHRINCEAAYQAALESKRKGADVVKQWDGTLDGKTRPSHRRVDGETRELEEKFSNGLMYPGDPAGDAADVVNCRCVALTRARSAMDESELETLKQRAEYFGLDKSKELEDFKDKYLEATNKMAAVSGQNDWSKAIKRTVTQKEKEHIIDYAKERGINIINLKDFDGDTELMKSEIDVLSRLKSEYGITTKLTVTAGRFIDGNDFAETIGNTVRFNTLALRNRSVTSFNITKDGGFASTNLEDIAAHEFGHILATKKGNIGLEIAQKAYYNVHGISIGIDETILFLEEHISEYSVYLHKETKRFNPRDYKEIIPEVLAKHNSNSDEFTKEFVSLLKGVKT